jgi:hypothetical protein
MERAGSTLGVIVVLIIEAIFCCVVQAPFLSVKPAGQNILVLPFSCVRGEEGFA